jgi:hypothetical protein
MLSWRCAMGLRLGVARVSDEPVEWADDTMTDAGGFLPTQDTKSTTDRARLLRQIATALDIPVSTFTRAPSAEPGQEPSSSECAAMIAAFTRIRDPKMRDFCLRMLESFAKRGGA